LAIVAKKELTNCICCLIYQLEWDP